MQKTSGVNLSERFLGSVVGEVFQFPPDLRGRLDLEYLDETSSRKVSLRERADMEQRGKAKWAGGIGAHGRKDLRSLLIEAAHAICAPAIP